MYFQPAEPRAINHLTGSSNTLQLSSRRDGGFLEDSAFLEVTRLDESRGDNAQFDLDASNGQPLENATSAADENGDSTELGRWIHSLPSV